MSLAHPGKKTKKAPKATKYRVSRKQCPLSASAPEDYESSKFRTAPAGWGRRRGRGGRGGDVSVLSGDANISWDCRPLSLVSSLSGAAVGGVSLI